MESVSELIQTVLIAAAVGMLGVLVSRRRQHLKLVVRVIDSCDQDLVAFLDDLVQRGELVPAAVA
ncbi:MAG TPA: hypothetical protein VGX76_17180 [Pirellulales bacterium]|jgi:hypothetical protein|nr:hypothetical protein [Pirellulales bacterium]